MKLSLTVKRNEEHIAETEEGQETRYRLVMEGEGGVKVIIVGAEPFEGFPAKMRVSATIASPQATLD